MKITIQKAKNGEETALADNHFLHSNYAPQKEAERFVENISIPYTPSAIIISEPALSYITVFLRNKFPDIKLGAIRYTDSFNAYNKDFDFVLNYYEHADFENYLEGRFTEEELLNSFFIPWTPSAQTFIEEDKLVWNSIKAALERSKTLLITRQYFEKHWFLNSCSFIKYLNTAIDFEAPVNKPALIISSGPSLISFIDTIKKNQNRFFIIALSSAITACIKNEIKPDLCLSTDGGYWAAEHLKPLYKHNIPLAMPAEAYCKKSLFSKLSILPLDYGDGISHELLSNSNIKAKKAVRNGTVSGTALLFAAKYCSKDIFFCGLDLAEQKGFQHTQPNQLEANSSTADFRIKNKMTRLTRAQLTTGSLEIYKNWFINNPLKLNNRKVFRLIENKDRKNNLNWIEDLELNSFTSLINNLEATDKISFKTFDIKKDFTNLTKLLTDETNSEKIKRQIFPLDYVQLSHNPDNKSIPDKINKEWEKLKIKAGKILDADL